MPRGAARTLRVDQRKARIASVTDFLEDLLKLRSMLNHEKLWYRGQSNAQHGLVPTVGRDHVYAGRTRRFPAKIELELLHRFRRRTYLEFGRLLTAGEALFVARHHGLPTRLLDWTANALFGLFFACDGDANNAGKLWALKRYRAGAQLDSLEIARCDSEPQLIRLLDGGRGAKPRFKLIEPLYNSPRLRAQDGGFTVHDRPDVPLEKYEGTRFREKDLDVELLVSWTIEKAAKRTLIEELSGLGITRRIVYPDLDGIARSLWETDVLWCGKDLPARSRNGAAPK